MNKQYLKLALGIAISAACLWFLYQHVDLAKLKAALMAARQGELVLAVAAYMMSMVVRSLRLHFLLRPMKSVSPVRLFPIIIVGYAANNLLPFRLGEVVRAYFTNVKEGIPRSGALSAIVVERIFDGLTVAMFLSLGLFTMDIGDSADMSQLRLIMWAAGGAFFGAFMVCVGLVFQRDNTLSILERVFSFETGGIGEKVMPIVHKLASGLEVLRSAKDSVIVLLLSFAAWVCEAGMFYTVGHALGIGEQVPFTTTIVVLAIINLSIMIPSSPGFVGTFDYAGVWTLGKFGIVAQTAVAYTVLVHLGQFLSTTILGLIFMWVFNISVVAAQKAAETVSPEDEASAAATPSASS